MRLKIANTYVAGHPDAHPLDWTGCQGARWSPSRLGGWQAGSGHERVGFDDAGVMGFTFSFGVTRAFKTIRAAAAFIAALHGRTPPHPWSGAAELVIDMPPGGSVTLALGECVLQLAAPVRALNHTGNLTVEVSYMLHGGVIGAQPVVVPPVTPPVTTYDDYADDYDVLDPVDGAVAP